MPEAVRVYYLCAGVSAIDAGPSAQQEDERAGELVFPEELPDDIYSPGRLVLPRSRRFWGSGRQVYVRCMQLGGDADPTFFDVELIASPTNGHRFSVANIPLLNKVEFTAFQIRNYRPSDAASRSKHLGSEYSLWCLQPRDRGELERLALEHGFIFLGTGDGEEGDGGIVDPPEFANDLGQQRQG